MFNPLSQVEEGEIVRSVVFCADADQIVARSILANYLTGAYGMGSLSQPAQQGAGRWVSARMQRTGR